MSEAAPGPVGPYSPAVRVGDWVITSGQLGVRARSDGVPELIGGGVEAQLRQAVRNVELALAEHGATLADVRKATVFLVGMEQFAELNAVWIEVFGEWRPARSAVGVAALPLGARVEVEVWAHSPGAG